MGSLKLGKRSWLVVLVGALVIAVLGLSVTYFRQVDQYTQMKAQYTQMQTNLAQVQIDKLKTNKANLEAELKEVEAEGDEIAAQLAMPVTSSIVTRTLFDIAGRHNLTVTSMTSSVPSKERLHEVELSQTSVTACVEGDSADLIGFIIDLDRRFSTGVIESVDIIYSEDPETLSSSVELTMCIYTTRG